MHPRVLKQYSIYHLLFDTDVVLSHIVVLVNGNRIEIGLNKYIDTYSTSHHYVLLSIA